jgi:CBS domain-containing protein
MKARDIMTKNIECVTADDTAERAACIMRDEEVGIVPVVENQKNMKLSGVVTDRDITIRMVAEGKNSDTRVRDVMSDERLVTVRPDADITEVMDRMKTEQVRRIPVVEDDRIVGIIAQADLATEGPGDSEVGEVVERISEPGGRHTR